MFELSLKSTSANSNAPNEEEEIVVFRLKIDLNLLSSDLAFEPVVLTKRFQINLKSDFREANGKYLL